MNQNDDLQKNFKVCICTSYRADREPRAPRHVKAIAELSSEIELTFIDCAPVGEPSSYLQMLDGFKNVTFHTHFYPHRKSNILFLLLSRLWQYVAQILFQNFQVLIPAVFGTNVIGLETKLKAIKADIYLAHNIDTLLCAARAAQSCNALLMFDSMEYHLDMGDSQTRVERQITHQVQSQYLSKCALVLASSDEVADELMKEYNIELPLSLYNVPSIEPNLAPKDDEKLELYWRNSVIGLGQRGLDEALLALTKLPDDVTLHLQGRMPLDNGKMLREQIAELGITERVIFHPPYAPEEAVKMASSYTIGLCMERKGVRNHDFTVSNKMFDYLMAGLVVIASDLPGLRRIIEKSKGGLLFEPGSAEDLARKVLILYDDRSLINLYSQRARDFALSEGNRDFEMAKFIKAFTTTCDRQLNL